MKKILSLFKNRKFTRSAIAIIIFIALVGFYIYYQKTTGRIFIDNSLIQAPVITISSPVSGKIREIDVKEGQKVSIGDALAIVGTETLRADTGGLIISASNLEGSTVNPQTQLIQMIRPSDLRVAGTIDENKGLRDIRIGQVISFTIDAFPEKTYWGFVDEISPSAKVTQLSFSISTERPTQQFLIYAVFDSAKYPEIKNGMSAKMTVYTETK